MRHDGRNINILVSRKKLEWVAYNHKLTAHAEAQMMRRDTSLNFDLRERILNSPLAWKTASGCIAIALDLYNYIVVNADTGDRNPAIVVTFVNVEERGISVIDKMLMSYREIYKKSN